MIIYAILVIVAVAALAWAAIIVFGALRW